MVDVQIENHGSILVFQPMTDFAWDWLDEHVSEDAQYWGGLVVEPRYAEDLVVGMRESGLEV